VKGLISLAANATRALSGSALYSLLQLAALAIVTRRGGQPDAADWFFAQAVATPIAFFCSLRLKEQLSVDDELSAYGHRVRRMLTTMAIFAAVAIPGWAIFSTGQLRIAGIAFLLANLSQQAIGAYQGLMARSSRFTLPSQIDTLLGILSVASVWFAYQTDRGLALAAILTAMTWTAVAAIVLFLSTAKFRRSTEPTRSSVPLADDLAVGFAAATQSGQISTARIGADLLVGQAAIAAIGTASFFVRIGVLLVAGIRAAIGPLLANARQQGALGRQVSRAQRWLAIGLTLGALPGGLLGALLGPPILRLLFGPDVIPQATTCAIVVASAMFLYGSMVLDQMAIAVDIRRRMAHSTTIAFIATLITIVPLSLIFGEPGAAGALAVGYFVRYLILNRWVSSEVARSLS